MPTNPAEYMQVYYAINKDKIRAMKRIYYESNAEKKRAQARERYYANEEYRKNKNVKIKQRVYEEGAIRFVRRLFEQ